MFSYLFVSPKLSILSFLMHLSQHIKSLIQRHSLPFIMAIFKCSHKQKRLLKPHKSYLSQFTIIYLHGGSCIYPHAHQ